MPDGFPLLEVIALVGGVIGLVWRDFLETIVAIFLIGFGLLGVLPFLGVDVSAVTSVIGQVQDATNSSQ